MDPIFRSLGAAWWGLKGAFAAGRDLRVWSPLMSLALLRLALLLLLVFFHRPEIVALGEPLVVTLAGPEALRYPEHLFAVPAMIARVDPLILLFAGALAFGRSLRMFARAYLPEWNGPGTRRTFSLIAVTALWLALEIAVTALFASLPEAIEQRGGKLGLAFLIVQLGLLTLLRFPFVHAFAAVAVLGDSAWGGLVRSVRIASAEPPAAIVLAAIHAAAALPFMALLGPIGAPRLSASPEVVVILCAARLVVETLVWMVVLGATARIALWKAGTDR